MLILVGCAYWEDKTLPEQLYGIWETDEPRYQGCYLEIRKESLIFHTIEGDSVLNWVTKIETVPEPDKTLFNIYYEDREGLDYLLSLYYIETEDRDIIQFKNQDQIEWTKRKEF